VTWLRSRGREGLTKRLALFCVSCGLLLGSATPPAQSRTERPQPVRIAQAPAEATLPAPVAPAPAIPEPPVAPAPGWWTVAHQAGLDEIAAEAERQRLRALRKVWIVVSLPSQRAYVFRGGELIDSAPVSTGRPGHRTPTGRFPILQKRVHHYSNLYDNAPMPYMQRLTHGGIALHAGHLPGYPASHGCIRLPWGFARRLYRLTDFSSEVIITARRTKSSREALRLI
jgi:lipoprotein-anchoring transpeptidase ErfK/SrfK